MYGVMVVEDEKIIRTGIVSMVERFGDGLYVKYECANGYKAWEKFQIEPPDIVITDIVMHKGMTGLELIEKIRESGSNVAIIILSGYSEFSYAQTAMRYNVQEYMLKPVNVKQFALVLEKIKAELDAAEGTKENGSQTVIGKNKIICKVKEYIRANLDHDLSLPTVAAKVNISVNYLSMLFKNETHQKYSDYITNLRIEKAKHLLSNSDFKIYEIAELCGYNSTKHFIDVFKKTMGVTPLQYKNRGSA